MNISDLQRKLRESGRYLGALDGIYGPKTKAAVMLAMTDGPDTVLAEQDFESSASRLGVTPAHIKAVTAVESAGAGFVAGRPVLLFEPHRFSKATKGAFDASAPDVSYPIWDRSKYPRDQVGRYAQLLRAVGLDVDAGFASASYGRFQILGENYKACGFASAYEFAAAQAFDEVSQLQSFERFIAARGLLLALRNGDWATFARGYNGTAYKANAYDVKLANAFRVAGGAA